MSVQPSAREMMFQSVSFYLALEFIEKVKKADDNCANMALVYRCSAGIALIAIIETIVRGILSIPALATMSFLPEDLKNRVEEASPYGTYTSARVVSSCFSSIYGACTA